MAKDDRDVLEVLKSELDFIENGAYGRSVRTPWQPTSIFQDSPTCINFCDLERSRSCDECLLMEFVPPAARSESVPCHRIPLNRSSQTVESLHAQKSQADLGAEVAEWLRATISRIEGARAALESAQRRLWQKPLVSERKRILVIDDDEQVLIALESLLENEGYGATTAWSGQEALRLLRSATFDLILLDDYLTDVTTEEILRQLRVMPVCPPVLLMQTPGLSDDAAARYARLGACYFVCKNHPEQIAALTHNYLSLAKALPTHV